jgi:peptide/nickel transport system ATP-binding protein
MELCVENLTTCFRMSGGRVARAVDGVSFSLREGRTLALVGESGCGKSQTAFSIMQLLAPNAFHEPGSRILLDGEDLLQKDADQMREIRGNDIAMIFQEPMTSLNPLYRVGNQLAEPLMLHQEMDKEAARARSIELLDQVGIPDPEARLQSFPHELSGGMKQRVMIAMALACRPRLLIADEPTTALDVTIQAQILGVMRDLQKELGMAILLITHDLGVVHRIADDVCVMYAGKIAEFASRECIFSDMRHPYTRRLFESLPSAVDRRFRLRTIPGLVPPATQYGAGCRFHDRCVEKQSRCETEASEGHACGEGHVAFCHLLEPGASEERHEADAREPRPERKLGEMLLEVEDLRTWFPVRHGLLRRTVNHVRAVDGVNLTLRRGETLALVGESGCGKTTAGQSILRLIREARGRVSFLGKDIMSYDKKALKALREDMQIVFQDPFASLSPRLRVGEIVAEGLTIHYPKMSREEREQKVADVLHEVGLSASASGLYPHEFSGGQRQRISIARALILEPDFLVLDEPTSALDISVQAQILNLLEEIQVQRQLAYMFITHDLGVVRYIADVVAVMYLGRIVELGPTESIFQQARHPYTRTLLAAVPKLDEDRELPRIEGDVPSPLRPPSGCHFYPRCPLAEARCREEAPELRRLDSGSVACHLVDPLRD